MPTFVTKTPLTPKRGWGLSQPWTPTAAVYLFFFRMYHLLVFLIFEFSISATESLSQWGPSSGPVPWSIWWDSDLMEHLPQCPVPGPQGKLNMQVPLSCLPKDHSAQEQGTCALFLLFQGRGSSRSHWRTSLPSHSALLVGLAVCKEEQEQQRLWFEETKTHTGTPKRDHCCQPALEHLNLCLFLGSELIFWLGVSSQDGGR
jgi:hypothetical protein